MRQGAALSAISVVVMTVGERALGVMEREFGTQAQGSYCGLKLGHVTPGGRVPPWVVVRGGE
jgi:hypothetical protein